jgi:hypothetical protein
MQELLTSDFNNNYDQIRNHEEVKDEDYGIGGPQIHQKSNMIPKIHPSNKVQNT